MGLLQSTDSQNMYDPVQNASQRDESIRFQMSVGGGWGGTIRIRNHFNKSDLDPKHRRWINCASDYCTSRNSSGLPRL